jgi:hypothetical protein
LWATPAPRKWAPTTAPSPGPEKNGLPWLVSCIACEAFKNLVILSRRVAGHRSAHRCICRIGSNLVVHPLTRCDTKM